MSPEERSGPPPTMTAIDDQAPSPIARTGRLPGTSMRSDVRDAPLPSMTISSCVASTLPS